MDRGGVRSYRASSLPRLAVRPPGQGNRRRGRCGHGCASRTETSSIRRSGCRNAPKRPTGGGAHAAGPRATAADPPGRTAPSPVEDEAGLIWVRDRSTACAGRSCAHRARHCETAPPIRSPLARPQEPCAAPHRPRDPSSAAAEITRASRSGFAAGDFRASVAQRAQAHRLRSIPTTTTPSNPPSAMAEKAVPPARKWLAKVERALRT